MTVSDSPLLISLKPHYADLIFKGVKKAELRRRDLSRLEGRDVFVYVTSPVMELQGGFRVGEVLTGKPEDIWDAVSKDVGVEKPDFDAYYSGRELACALKITKVWEYEHPLSLSALRDAFENFVVPQSWRYVRPAEHEYFQRMKKRGEGAKTAAVVSKPASQGQLPLLQSAPA